MSTGSDNRRRADGDRRGLAAASLDSLLRVKHSPPVRHTSMEARAPRASEEGQVESRRTSVAGVPAATRRPGTRPTRWVAIPSTAGTPRLPAVAWSLPGEWPARRPAAPGEPTLALPGPSGTPSEAPSPRLLARWDRFAGLELAGAGGMGRVYRGTDRRSGRQVAVKLLLEERHPGDELREARLQARVAHPGVLPVLAQGALGGMAWFAMPFVDGCTLEDAAARLPLAQRLAVVADVCRSVAAAHDRGIVHCDINPRNVLVAPVPGGLRSWLIDFGIAEEMARRETTSGHVFGTPAYMAPEQALGRWWEIDPRTDVYGLGATLYELASGRRPFSAETSEALLDRAVRDEPRPLAALAPGVSPRLERAVLACLAKEPARRYPSARALASELDRLAAS